MVSYAGFLTTGSGSDRVRLAMSESEALIVVQSQWMGIAEAVPRRCASALASMQPLGYADWNDPYDLLLLVCDEGWPEGPVWEHAHHWLDRARLSRVDD